MLPCAFCETDCVPTREHLIPGWYGSSSATDEWEVFNARSPTKHRYGSQEIKDVCSVCNNERLSHLDGYGKEVYERYLKVPAYLGESTDFEVDRFRFVRWLTKLCYNSARVHNADVTVLRKYRRFILGLDQTPEPLVYVHLVTATDFSTVPPSPARRIIGGHPDVVPAQWFRLAQFRGTTDSVSTIVQRQVYIDSYCFTLFAVDPDDDTHLQELPPIELRFKELFRHAQIIPPNGRLTLTASDTHAVATILRHMQNYPVRYGDGALSASPDFAEVVGGLVHGDTKVLAMVLAREEIESNDISGTTERLNELVATRESAMASMQRVALVTDGYDDDPRELWEIPEVRLYMQRVFAECPHLFFLAYPASKTIEVFMACCCRVIERLDDGRCQLDPQDVERFIETGFHGLNEVTQRFAISTEINRAISNDVFGILTSE